MFHNMEIASTAISSFNNAALYSPFFLVVGLLTLPLFFMVYVYGRDFVSRFGWNNQNSEHQINFWIASITGLWLLLFGGNYAVIRDGISLLPVMIATVLFCLTFVSAQQIVKLHYLSQIQNIRYKWAFVLVLFLMIGLSGMPTWWGFLLQTSAFLCGMIAGCRSHKNISLLGGLVPVLSMLLVLILMQPEYFRFGQLGNLTLIHLLFVFVTGFFAVTALVTKAVKSCRKIRETAYIKLKWLSRIFSILAFLLFILTESVPVFIGLLVCVGLSEILTIYHMKQINGNITKNAVSWFIFCFGLILINPVISSLGIIYSLFNKNNVKVKDYIELL